MGKLDIIIKTLENKQASNIKVIDLENKSSIADYFIIATGNSINQNKALLEYIEENLKKENYDILSVEGLRDGNWILIDCGDVVVHIFTSSQRSFYNIEDLWES
ncbi:ribosome silencing factor [Anaerococcus sp. AGMB00486]|uniref:Ribosomal silencing factor RsfS n=2 Tax=Anaerococcus TaxID=165779 RepID=A0ABX2N7F3_9FIRM|nr:MULTISPECIES: ribosome silencing factor [Anaerococcus]MDY3005472.1 ribosome silencing factor [Anaerococcus porci]MSS76900.1 ribosome silencing factor [Anaerococcus porci]NVF10616.1 ribosome silencing factor [Anaerococcus faecalis]